MDCKGDNVLQDKHCCFDGKENSCCNSKTLSASVYYPLQQKQLWSVAALMAVMQFWKLWSVVVTIKKIFSIFGENSIKLQ